jgi:hypothetical protein
LDWKWLQNPSRRPNRRPTNRPLPSAPAQNRVLPSCRQPSPGARNTADRRRLATKSAALNRAMPRQSGNRAMQLPSGNRGTPLPSANRVPPNRARQNRALQSRVRQSRALQNRALQSRVRQSHALQSHALQSHALQSHAGRAMLLSARLSTNCSRMCLPTSTCSAWKPGRRTSRRAVVTRAPAGATATIAVQCSNTMWRVPISR